MLLSYLTYTCYVASFEGLFSYVDSTHPASSQGKGYGILEVAVCRPRLQTVLVWLLIRGNMGVCEKKVSCRLISKERTFFQENKYLVEVDLRQT